ncbi:MAG TPA: PspA/IM30 family protein [Polyangiaceae bacterium]|nr:PspA/IM30 family protein [Polyangiaceae bacterium]
MGILSRLATLIKSNLNDLISRSEDPEKMLEQIVLDMSQQLLEAKKQVAVSIADEKRLRAQSDQQKALVAEWEKKAMLAVRAGNDELAREALARKKEHSSLSEQYEQQWAKQKQAVDQLKLALRALNSKIEEAKRKKGLLIARKKRAEAQRSIQETMSGLRSTSAFDAFDRMSSKIEQMEAEAEAGAELAEQYSGDVLAQKLQQLEATSGADEDLLELKRKMGVLPPAPAPAERAPVRVAQPAAAEEPELSAAEQEELAKALAELDAEEQQLQQVKR